LAGASNVQRSPIRIGCTEGGIIVDLGEMIVHRRFKYDKNNEVTTSLQVENKEGVRFSSPQAMLDKMLGDFAFDPLAFARASSDEQFNKLRQFVPDVDFKAIDAANKKDYESRTDLNRRAKEKRAAAAQIMITTTQAQLIDETKLVEEIAKAGQHNANITVRKNNRNNFEREIVNKRQQIKDLEFQIQQIQSKLDTSDPLPKPIDVTELQNKIAAARYNNEQFRLCREKDDHILEAVKFEIQSADLTKAIEQRDADKQSKIAAAKLPVPGITFGDNMVMLNGVPFEQASDAEQLKASIAIAMALNPKLRVIRVRDGSLLDESSMVILGQMADQNDCQVWIERVENGKCGYIIEDGHAREAVAPESEPDVV